MSGSGIHFQVAQGTLETRRSHFQRAHVVGIDRMPWPSQVDLRKGEVVIRRAISQSGSVHLPWPIEGFGEVFVQTAHLMEREIPYRFLVELARGQINKVRQQLGDWEMAGLRVRDDIKAHVKRAVNELARAIWAPSLAESEDAAQLALREILWGGEMAAALYSDRAIRARRRSTGKLATLLGTAFDPLLFNDDIAERCRPMFDHLSLPLNWRVLEPVQGEFDWATLDRQVQWCVESGIPFSVGPLIDFRPQMLPHWLTGWQSDVQSLVTLMMDLVESCLSRYRDKVTMWETTIRSNSADVMGMNEEQMLWLSGKLIEVARHVHPKAQFIMGVDQPWGEYLAVDDRSFSPFSFVDTLTRMNLELSALTVEVAMGYSPNGSYCRSLMDFSRMLDHYHDIGMPLRLRMSFPSASVSPDLTPEADDIDQTALDTGDYTEEGTHIDLAGSALPEVRTRAGQWHGPPSPEHQADWAEQFLRVALAKPFVELVSWGQLSDAGDGGWPHAGLFDPSGNPKEVFQRLQQLRESCWDST